ncbi:MAG: hypothetical protein LBN07_04970 [Christensenellaceae bacterium]|nr:hypothetical protein [Christensenellaceae bacterium]
MSVQEQVEPKEDKTLQHANEAVLQTENKVADVELNEGKDNATNDEEKK